VFGDDLDAETLAQLDAVRAACIARDLHVAAFRDESGALLEFLDRGMPPHAVLLITASTADARKRVFKRLRDLGGCLVAEVERERSGALARDSVDGIVARVTAVHGKRLARDAHDLLVRRAGTDPALLAAEVEKVCLFAAERPTVTVDDVRLVVRDMAGAWIFDFTSALAGRKLAEALPLLRGLFAQGEPPLRLLGMVAREMRMLLLARECLDGPARERWRADLSFGAFQTRLAPVIDAETLAALGKPHPFVLYRRFQDAARVSAAALRAALVRLADLDLRLKSSRGDPALMLEWFVIEWCRTEMRAAAS
jgi:DNA polymerase-3 subunit delta